MSKREKAADLNGKGMQLQKRGKLKEAIELFRKASFMDPSWSTPPYNLGLIFKNQRKWEESLKYNERATALDRTNAAAWWNLGIAATALGRWKVARAAWRGYGIDVPAGDGPIDLPCGLTPIRLHPNGNAEIVWSRRLDPARAALISIPFPESNYRWGDIVLNDGAPMGYRQHQGKDVPVFNALDLLEPSAFGTFVASVAILPEHDVCTRLAEIAIDREGSAEDWSTSTRLLCKACSEGRLHEAHDTERAPAKGVHLIGIAARSHDHAAEILRAWEAETEGVEVQSIEDALGPGKTG